MPNFLVLEFGSKSLKIHRKTGKGNFEKVKVGWSLGHEVYREGLISAATRKRICEVIARLEARGFRKEAMLAIGTGAVRDAGDRDEFIAFLKEKLGIALRILSGREEASLLAQGFLGASTDLPALVLDIGGGSLETVYLEAHRTVLRDSLPLGAIRLHYLGVTPGGEFNHGMVEEYIDGVLREATTLRLISIHGTGGPVKAIAKVVGSDLLTLAALDELEERVRREGPPASLSEERKTIFLPGVMVLRRLVRHSGARDLRYVSIPIGRIFLERFLGQARPELRDSDNMRLLKNISLTKLIHPRNPELR